MNKASVAITFAVLWVVLLVSAGTAHYIGEAYNVVWVMVWLFLLMAESKRQESLFVRFLVAGLVASVWPGWAVILAASPLMPAGSLFAPPRASQGAGAGGVEDPHQRKDADKARR